MSQYRNSRKRNRKQTNEQNRKNPNPALLNLYRRMRSRYSLPRPRSGGGRRPPGGYFRHHNFRYDPEPPAYKTPKPEYPSYTKREVERPAIHRQYSNPIDEKFFQRFMRRFWKEYLENEELIAQQSPEIRQEFPELESKNTTDEIPDVTLREIDRATGILEKYFTKEELTPLIEYAEKKRQEIIEARFDPERLLRQLEANPTEELVDKTLAQLSAEPKFQEEEVEGCKIETDRLSPTAISDSSEQLPEVYELADKGTIANPRQSELIKNQSEPENVEISVEPNSKLAADHSPEVATENLPEEPVEQAVVEAATTQPIETELAEPSEVDMLENPLLASDIEALYNELEAEELEPEEEPVEPSY